MKRILSTFLLQFYASCVYIIRQEVGVECLLLGPDLSDERTTLTMLHPLGLLVFAHHVVWECARRSAADGETIC